MQHEQIPALKRSHGGESMARNPEEITMSEGGKNPSNSTGRVSMLSRKTTRSTSGEPVMNGFSIIHRNETG